MSTNEKKGVTVKIDAKLHAEVRQYIEDHEMTMGEFVSLALQNELHPKLNMQEDKNMGNMRTLAFQVPEELFQKIKDYLQRNNITQKQFVIGLIENEIERDLTQRAAVSDCESVFEEVGEQSEEQERANFSDDFEAEDTDKEEELDDEQDESEDQGMSMGM